VASLSAVGKDDPAPASGLAAVELGGRTTRAGPSGRWAAGPVARVGIGQAVPEVVPPFAPRSAPIPTQLGPQAFGSTPPRSSHSLESTPVGSMMHATTRRGGIPRGAGLVAATCVAACGHRVFAEGELLCARLGRRGAPARSSG
jgi:hypothetical protein